MGPLIKINFDLFTSELKFWLVSTLRGRYWAKVKICHLFAISSY